MPTEDHLPSSRKGLENEMVPATSLIVPVDFQESTWLCFIPPQHLAINSQVLAEKEEVFGALMALRQRKWR